MAKSILITLILILAAAFLVTPAAKQPESMAGVTFINEVEEAEIWILPQTEEILKTSLWGKATFVLEAGEEAQFDLAGAGGPGTYIFRVIDANEGYYEANDLHLEDGMTLRFTDYGGHPFDAVLEIIDAGGEVIDTIEDTFIGVL